MCHPVFPDPAKATILPSRAEGGTAPRAGGRGPMGRRAFADRGSSTSWGWSQQQQRGPLRGQPASVLAHSRFGSGAAGRIPRRHTLMAPPASRHAGPRALGFLLLVLGPVAAMEIYTPGALEVLNGTNVRLKCTFHSPFPAGQKLAVSWYFQSEMKEPLELVLYYNDQAYPSQSGRFLGRLTWDGHVHKSDASVMLHNVSPKDNGTFQCHVKNPPDVDGVVGEIRLSVVLKVSFSEVHILVLTIGLSCAVMVTAVVVVVTWRHWRRMQQGKEMEVDGSEQLRLEEKETPLPGPGAGQP